MTFDPILVADAETEVRATVVHALTENGFSVDNAGTGQEALQKFRKGRYSLIIADAGIPELSGMEVLSEVKSISPHTPVIMVTANGSVNHAVQAMQAGASDYLLKPFSADTLKAAVNKIVAEIRRSVRRIDGSGAAGGGTETKPFIARSPAMLHIMQLARKIAPSRATILIQGESGTGKEVMAAFIHHHSGRRDKPFVAINCAALPDTLAESELFGHEKGAFTGAFAGKAGKFEQASGGTLLLDEISEMSLPLQAKLLRVLQEQQVDRIGGNRPVPIDTRVIAVSNVDLQKAVETGQFREDLFFRINVVPITVPPLRDRKEDIPLLAAHFLEKYSALNGSGMRDVADETIVTLQQNAWKGNVRELENTIERAVLLGSGDTLLPSHLMVDAADSHPGPAVSIQAGMSVREMEKKLIFHTLKTVDDNRTQAAELLGISIRTLRNKLREYKESA